MISAPARPFSATAIVEKSRPCPRAHCPFSIQPKPGQSDPLAISLTPFELQLANFGEACRTGSPPASFGIDGYRALQLIGSIYISCTEDRKVKLQTEIE